MRFTVEREHLLPAMSFVRKYAAANNKIPILADVLIEAKDGRVSLTATDLDQAASDSVPAAVHLPGAATLPATVLFDVIKGASGTDVTIETDDQQARIACGKSKFKLPFMLGSDFPPLPMLTSEATTRFTIANLGEIDRCVMFAAEPDKGRYFLAGVSWKVVDDRIEFVATDGKKFSLMSIPAPVEARAMPAIIVPRFGAPAWTGDVNVFVSDLFIRYQSGEQVVASKLIEASYPDYHRLIPKNDVHLLFDRDDLVAALSRMAVATSAGDSSILFVGRDGVATISAESSGREAVDEVSYRGGDFQISISCHAIAPIIASFDCEIIEWRFARHDVGITIHDPRNEGRLALAMPVRDARLSAYIPSVFRDAAE